LTQNDDQQDSEDDKRPGRRGALAWSGVDIVDVDIPRDVSSVNDAGPFGVSSWQDPGLDTTGESRLEKQSTHDLGLFCPDVGQLSHPFLSSMPVHPSMLTLDWAPDRGGHHVSRCCAQADVPD
jgi:hypothetical protein